MTAQEIIKEAEKHLPIASTVECDRYRALVQNNDWMDHAGTKYNNPFYVVEFQKLIVSGIIKNSWELVGIINGI